MEAIIISEGQKVVAGLFKRKDDGCRKPFQLAGHDVP